MRTLLDKWKESAILEGNVISQLIQTIDENQRKRGTNAFNYLMANLKTIHISGKLYLQ